MDPRLPREEWLLAEPNAELSITTPDKTRSTLDLIGNTPLITLARVHPGPGRIVAKAEFLNPGGSIKDRPARLILERARADGRLQAGQPVVALTSGNFGAGLAVVGAVLGHRIIAVMSSGNSAERRAMLTALGTEVVLTPQVDGGPGEVTGADIAAAAARAEELARDRGALLIDQFTDPASVEAHSLGTGPELLAQAGKIDMFVAAVGSGGTFVGVASCLKAHNPEILCVAVEPVGAQALAGHAITKPRHLLQGAGYGYQPPHWRPELMDRSIAIRDAEATQWRGILAAREGLYVGYTAAANVCAAVRLARQLPSDAVVATVLCDTGLKYPAMQST
jgi:cysteine synthase A